jgi:hypothetical protein
MRKLAAILFTVVAALGVVAQTAAADAPNATSSTYSMGGITTSVCTTPLMQGQYAVYGTADDFIDGCTVKLACPNTVPGCTVWMNTNIAAYGTQSAWVTQNARLRVMSTFSGSVSRFYDRSCRGTMSCGIVTEAFRITGGQSASVQCNGVRQHFAGSPPAADTCAVQLQRG